ncbi:hypothetical protein MICAB_2660004 [Microcystis aeruginosa PCC 9717]|uniref:Uncharacterized protein n=2 Tax=Microcystaceae TaxID=1890449 RepID=I4FMI7_MICAE|nr:hypothetical protein MICAB_2660004 [Microcystis aeruginosa PCC 9717]
MIRLSLTIISIYCLISHHGVALSKRIIVHHIITKIIVKTMNEQRAQAYVNLIEQLLACADGEEPNILQANQELIDPEFLQMMENYATGLE